MKFILIATLAVSINFSTAKAGLAENGWIEIDNQLSWHFKNNKFQWNDKNNETMKDSFEDIYDGKTCKRDEVSTLDPKVCEGVGKIVKDIPAFFEEAKYFHAAFGVRRNDDDFFPISTNLFDPSGSAVETFEMRLGKIEAFNLKLQAFKEKFGLSEIFNKADGPLRSLHFYFEKDLSIKNYDEQVKIYESFITKSKKLKTKDLKIAKRCEVFENKVKNMKTSCDHIKVTENDEKDKKLKELKSCIEESSKIMFDKQYKGCPSFQDF